MDINQFPIDDITDQLDENNRQMLEKLNEAYPVEFRIWQENHYSVVLKTKDVPEPKIVVFIYKPLSQEKIAHELLHMFCQLTLGTNECMLSTPEDDILIRKIFTEDFCEQLLNNAEHVIMFPEYKDFGYEPLLFFEPFEDPGNKIALFKSYGIRNHGKKYSLSMVVNYLALCIHLNSFPINNSCQKYLKEIKNIEYPLYYAVSCFFKGLNDMDISPDNYDYMQSKYKELRTNIINWLERNKGDIIDDFS